MRVVQVISPGASSPGGRAFLHPLHTTGPELADRSWKVQVHSSLDVPEGEVIVVDSKALRAGWDDGTSAVALERLRLRTELLLFFDTSDSATVVVPGALPFVDRYCKGQLFAERGVYRQPLYGGRLHTHHAHEQAGIRDEDDSWSQPISPADIAKLRVSWNLGMGPPGLAAELVARVPALATVARRIPLRRADPDRRRPQPISGRMTTSYARPTVAHQRQELLRRVGSRYPQGRVSRSAYRRELARSRLVLSPFGWGEVNTKDFEVFLAGAALVKPSLSHLETWPDHYRAGETYLAHAWDLSDLEETLDRALVDPRGTAAVAREGQDTYVRTVTTAEGRSAFAQRADALFLGR